jgi:hypothetical protein
MRFVIFEEEHILEKQGSEKVLISNDEHTK